MKKKSYHQPQVTKLDLYIQDTMVDFSFTEVIPGPGVNPDPNDGVDPGEALLKGFSIWDEE